MPIPSLSLKHHSSLYDAATSTVEASSTDNSRTKQSYSFTKLNNRNAAGSSILSCTIHLANTVIGAGMLGLPGAYAACG